MPSPENSASRRRRDMPFSSRPVPARRGATGIKIAPIRRAAHAPCSSSGVPRRGMGLCHMSACLTESRHLSPSSCYTHYPLLSMNTADTADTAPRAYLQRGFEKRM